MWWKENKAEWKKAAGFSVVIYPQNKKKNKKQIPVDIRVQDVSNGSKEGSAQSMKRILSSFLSTFFDLSVLPPCGQLQVLKDMRWRKSTAHVCHFFTAAISKFIETDWLMQIIVKLILPLNMKLERGLRGHQARPNIKNRRLMVGCKNGFVIITIDQEKKKNLHKST